MIRMTTRVPTPMYTSTPFSREPPDQQQQDGEDHEGPPDEERDAAEETGHPARTASAGDGCLELPRPAVRAVGAAFRPVPRRCCPLGHVLRDTRRGVRRNGSGTRRAGREDGVRHRFASTPPCAKRGSSPPQARSDRLNGIVEHSPSRVGADARAFAHAAGQEDENRLSTPVTGMASERTTSRVAGGEGRGLEGPRPAAACC
jgi:hypothetical protein